MCVQGCHVGGGGLVVVMGGGVLAFQGGLIFRAPGVRGGEAYRSAKFSPPSKGAKSTFHAILTKKVLGKG